MAHPLNDVSLLRKAAYFDGTWIESTPHGHYAVSNPATGETLADLPRFQEAEARAEVDYAASFVQWFSEEAKRGS